MKYHVSLFLSAIALCTCTSAIFSMDVKVDEQTALVHHYNVELDTIIIEDGITIQQAYQKGLRANQHGFLMYNDKNLTSCEGLSSFKTQLHLANITHLDFSRNKLHTLHSEFFTQLPLLALLNLSQNNIATICDPIPHHQNLATCYLYNNKLTKFPLPAFLENTPVKQLILHENQIRDYGSLSVPCPALELLWIDPTASYWTKQNIAHYCTGLNAEMCEGDTTVQEAHTKTEYTDECCKTCCSTLRFGAMTGTVFGLVGGIFNTFFCIFYKPCNTAIFGSLKSSGGVPLLLIGTPAVCIVTCSALCLLGGYCRLKPEKRIKKTILKQIAQYPPIIQKMKQNAQNNSEDKIV